MSIHRASSSSWGLQASARLCTLVVQSNTGFEQMIIEDKMSLLDIATTEELELSDEDSGLSAAYLAIYYDRPNVIRYLHHRGVDLSKFCDPMMFGTPYFYAIGFHRFEIVVALEQLGYSLQVPCDSFGQTPLERATKLGSEAIRSEIVIMIVRRKKASNLIAKNVLRNLETMRYVRSSPFLHFVFEQDLNPNVIFRFQKIRKSLILIQKTFRGYLGRFHTKVMRDDGKIIHRKVKSPDRKHRNKKVL